MEKMHSKFKNINLITFRSPSVFEKSITELRILKRCIPSSKPTFKTIISMNVETGVLTTVTSGYYIITFSAFVQVTAGEYTIMWLHHNGVRVEDSSFKTDLYVGDGGDLTTLWTRVPEQW